MYFYNRETEIETLRKIEENSNYFAQMTLLIGRRRIAYQFQKKVVHLQ